MTAEDRLKAKIPRARVFAIGAAMLLVLAALALHGVYLHLHRSLPKVQGQANAAGLTAKADIVRDVYGIPHIYAASKLDAFFAQGYAHAQDRLGQMDFARRLAAGRLSEFAGAVALPRDRFMRALNLYGVADRTYAQLPERTKAALQAYADGVNADLATRKGPLPLEFFLLRVQPEPWRPQDSIVMTRLLALQLASNLAGELTRGELLKTQTPQMLHSLFPALPGPLPKFAELYPTGDTQHASLDLPPMGASNNWAVSGAHSKTGKPLLANDPHLGLSLPCVWYLAHLSFEGKNLIGASLAGVPGIILGRNDNLAWGYTNSEVDAQDLVVERLDPQHKDHYIAPEGSVPLTARKERFKIKGQADLEETYFATRNGPVIPADLPSVEGLAPKDHVLALRWTALSSEDRTIIAGLDILEAANGAQFVETLKNWSGPTQNMVYADSEGAIGLYIPGRMPLRSADNDTFGLLPVPGWNAAYDWRGDVPPAQWPAVLNPADGVLVTANNKVIPPDYPYPLGYEWDRDARARRIRARIDAVALHDVASFRAIQSDTMSLEAQALLHPLLTQLAMHVTHHRLADEGRLRLTQWDGDMAADRPEPLLFAAWLREIERGLIGDELKDQFASAAGWRFDLIESVLDDARPPSRLCDNIETPQKEDCARIISEAFATALSELSRNFGDRMGSWRWGDAHRAVFPNRPLAPFPVIGALLERRIPSGGGADTVDRGQSLFSSATPFANVHASTYRAVYDLANPQESVFMISGGQSGNVFSRHYDDLIGPWAKGGAIKMTTDRKAVERGFHETLTLLPAPR